MIYLDHAATTAMYPEAVHKMLPFFREKYYNPSGIYREAASARKAIEEVRAQLAESIHARSDEIYFTSGGTESDNWALTNALRNATFPQDHALAEHPPEKSIGRGHIITSQIEHHAILHTCQFLEEQGYSVTYLPVDRKGFVRPEDVESAVRPDTVCISIMFANNEIGTIQPIREIGAIAARHHIIFHTDAVQAYGHLPIHVEEMNIQMMSASAHKFGGPKGCGFLYVRKPVVLTPMIFGGSQEKKRRAGTENVPGIVGMGEAARLSLLRQKNHYEKEKSLRDYLMKRILSEIDRAALNGAHENRLPGNLNISFRGVEGQSLLMLLELKGICASGGSACTSSDQGPSHVLKALGLPDDLAGGALRITIGYENTMEEMEYVFRCIKEAVEELRKL